MHVDIKERGRERKKRSSVWGGARGKEWLTGKKVKKEGKNKGKE